MEQFLTRVKTGSAVTSLACAAAGLVLLARPEITSSLICYVLGAVLIAGGVLAVLDFVRRRDRPPVYYALRLVPGVALGAAGIYLVANPDLIAVMIPRVIGVFVCLRGVGNLADALRIRSGGSPRWSAPLAAALVTVALGLILIFHSFAVYRTAMRVVGFFLLFAGLSGLLAAWQLRRVLHRLEQGGEDGVIDVEYRDVKDE